MSSLSVTLSLLSLPVFWIIMSWFGHREVSYRKLSGISRISIVGTLILFAGLLSLSAFHQPKVVEEQLLKLTALNALVIALVVFIGIMLMRFSRNYMIGEPCYPVFFRWMKLTLAAVVVTVMANHLAIFILGWIAISLGLHKLLLLYPERPRAVLAAHKKFIIARSSEILMLIAFCLLYYVYDTAYIDLLLARISTNELSENQYILSCVAAIFIVLAALLKCAQLPFHGWLIKVVEAPTPVSALLHAGVINLGGYLLLLFAPLLSSHIIAQWTLLVCAGVSTLLSALIMTTRISIKVRLAWSTSSQMGLMLVELALGLYSLAVLHLLAHSVYKAYAFLNSGNAVNGYLDRQIVAPDKPTFADWANALLISIVVVVGFVSLSHWHQAIMPWVLLTLSFTTYLAFRSRLNNQALFYTQIGIVVLLAASYTFGKSLTEVLLPPLDLTGSEAFSAMDIFASALVIIMFTLSLLFQYFQHHRIIQQCRQALFAGLYLDEWFTRVTLKLWPVELYRHISLTRTATVANLRNQ